MLPSVVQGKRFGKEITLYSVWFELRWGIIACLMLTVGLITAVFYNHPSTTNVTLFFRTVPIVPETIGRVAEVYVGYSGSVAQGAPLFKLDNSKQGGSRGDRASQDRRGRGGGGSGAASFSISRRATTPGLRRYSSCLVSNSSTACL